MNAPILEQHLQQPSITFLNKSGDITITWDESNKDKIIELIKKKMNEGYSFFTTKKVPLVNIERRVKVTSKNINKCEAIIITDEVFDKMLESIDDKDLVKEIQKGNAKIGKLKVNKNEDIPVLEKDPEKIADSKALAVKKIAGG